MSSTQPATLQLDAKSIQARIDTLQSEVDALDAAKKTNKNNDGINGIINPSKLTPKDYIAYLHDNYYGQNQTIPSPFGYFSNPSDPSSYQVPLLYSDWTASGKNLECIETFIKTHVYPYYGNTHTETSLTGKQTLIFRSEARKMILESPSVNADPNQDALVFVGNGCTGAIYTMANIILRSPQISAKKTVVFIGLYEHNSNIYIWLESGCKLIIIPESSEGGVDTKVLEENLITYDNDPNYELMIGSFSGASNVSGIIEKHDEITELLHKYGALAFWDYAAGAPYLNMNMSQDKRGSNINSKDNENEKEKEKERKTDEIENGACGLSGQHLKKTRQYVAEFARNKDAVFISSHKFLGGPGGPGILILKKKLYEKFSVAPIVPGGGTMFVAFGIDKDEYEYYKDIEEREEGGTPNIVGTIRSALAFKVKDYVGWKLIEKIETDYLNRFWKELGINSKDSEFNDKIEIIGNTKCPRLAIVAFNIKHKGKYLHYNFVANLFNQLFGIQGRGGCSCAGMYGMTTLKQLNKHNVDKKECLCAKSKESCVKHFGTELGTEPSEYEVDPSHMVREMKKGDFLAKLGYYRMNFHYTMTNEEFEYVVNCVKFVAKHGWKLSVLYKVDQKSGLYIHRYQKDDFLSLYSFKLSNIIRNGCKNERINENGVKLDFPVYWEKAQAILKNMKQYLPTKDELSKNEELLEDHQRFYWLPSELYDDVVKSLG